MAVVRGWWRFWLGKLCSGRKNWCMRVEFGSGDGEEGVQAREGLVLERGKAGFGGEKFGPGEGEEGVREGSCLGWE